MWVGKFHNGAFPSAKGLLKDKIHEYRTTSGFFL